MSVFQLVRVAQADGRREVKVLPVAGDADPTSFDVADQQPVYLGSMDVVDLAMALGKSDYVPDTVAIVDTHFERINGDEVAAEVADLIAAMRAGDTDEAHRVLVDELDPLMVESMTLLGKRSHRGAKIRLLQDGRFIVLNAGPAEPAEDVRRAVRDS